MANKILSQFRRIFITGVVVILPLFLTYIVFAFIFRQLNNRVSPLIVGVLEPFLPSLVSSPLFVFFKPLISVVMTVLVVFLIGLIATNFIGRRILNYFDRLMLKIPLAKSIYGAAKQFLESLRTPGIESFNQVVLLEYPKENIWAIGFVINETSGKTEKITSDKVKNVFVPTTPNPTSGYLLLVPESELVKLDMSIENALKYIVSGGLAGSSFEIVDQ